MKTTKYTFILTNKWQAGFIPFCFLFLSMTGSSVFAQDKENQQAKVEEKTSVSKPNSLEAVGNQIEFKNESTNSILTITDEGSNAGSILIPQGPILADPNDDNKLYNVGGTLHWNGSAVGTEESAVGWIDTGTKIHTATLSDKVGIATANPNSLLSVGGIGNISASISGTSISSGGIGVYGESFFVGVEGRVNSFGVGASYGGRFFSGTDDGIGVYGEATGLSAYAGYFVGRGYFSGNVGIGTQNPLSKLSVGGDGDLLAKIYAKNVSTDGYVVYGDAITSTTSGATNIGGYFSSNGEKGRGVYGISSGDKGRAVFGEASGANGSGIYGKAPITGWAGFFEGNVFVGGAITEVSDIRFKKDIIPIKNALNSLGQLSGVTYNWKAEEFPERNFDNTKIQIGVIAQDVEKIFPQLVNTDQDGFKSVDYIKLSVVTMQAVKEQNEIIIAQESTIKELENRLSKIESSLDGKRFTSASE